MIVERIEDHLMARVDDENRVFEANFDTLKVKDVVLVFQRDGERIGSIYNDDGTKRSMARLNTLNDEDFISVKVSKQFVEKILEKASQENMIQEQGTTLEAYKKRLNIE